MQNYKKLMGSISIVTASYAASRLLGFFREILLAKWTGVSGATDTLDLAFIIPDFLFYLSTFKDKSFLSLTNNSIAPSFIIGFSLS